MPGVPEDKEILIAFKRDFALAKDGRKRTLSEGRESRKYYDGHHWDETEKSALEAKGRAPIVINKTARLINVVKGLEILNPNEPKYLPRTTDSFTQDPTADDTPEADDATEASRYFRYQCNADIEERQMFEELLIESVGCTRSKLDFVDDQDGAVVVERVNPERVYWDPRCEKPNCMDGRFVIYRDILPKSEVVSRWGQDAYNEIRLMAGVGTEDPEAEKSKAPGADYTDDALPDSHFLSRGLLPVHEYQFFTFEKYKQWDDPAGDGLEPAELSIADHKSLLDRANKGLEEIQPTIDELDGDEMADPSKVYEAKAAQAEFLDLKGRLDNAADRERKVYWQVFVAAECVLEKSLSPAQTGFTYKFVTGMWDKTDKCYYGIVRAMKDPQDWYNKAVSLGIDILQTTPMGGVMVEEGAVEDHRAFEDSYSSTEQVTYVPNGSLSNSRIQPKQPSVMSPVLAALLEIAGNAVELVSGVNPEMMGVGGANTPVGTATARGRQGYTMLAFWFDRLSLYRREQGKVQLELMRKLPARLIRRVTGDASNTWVEFSGEKLAARYDVIVDQAPNSPNQQQEATEAIQTLIMPLLKAAGIPIQAVVPLIDDIAGIKASTKALLKRALMQAPPVPTPSPNPPPAGGPGQNMPMPETGPQGPQIPYVGA